MLLPQIHLSHLLSTPSLCQNEEREREGEREGGTPKI